MAERDALALARQCGQIDDRRFRRLPVDLGQHDVGRAAGEWRLTTDRRQLAGIAEHQHRLAERQNVVGHLFIDHRHLVQHDQSGVADLRLVVEDELDRADVG
jgi:hypothetical protein